MTEPIETTPYVAGDPAWQVPEADLATFSGKRHRHVLIIPVINEGERIRRQLKAIATLAPELDIAIADGGSTDGSLEAGYLIACRVRALLVKRGPGGLSAQLRMGYAWALDQGYLGVITMDGNGKDGVDALPAFVDALEAGADYVQGSRYAKGGKAINTPLDRALGVRLIHAPLISLASGRWMRDTTNGFRGYSRTLLEDDRVMPFRSVFDRYNLLFYLAISACRLGYVVRELPVERRYPGRGEAMPTKISGLMSKLALVGETLDAATGAFTPDARLAAGRGRRADKLVIGLFVAMVAVLFFNFVTTPIYSFDSWNYYEISKTVFGDFYRFSSFRNYVTETEYGSSFPPLWPTLIALVDIVFQTGARTGFGLAFAMFVAFAIMSELAGRAAFRVRWIGAGVALLTLIDEQMLSSEVLGGRSMPLQMFLLATLLYVLLEQRKLTIGHGVALGVLAGLAVMNRFDALPIPVVVGVGLLFLTRRLSIALAFAIGALVTMSPWVYYSITTFGSPFMTDNGAVALTVDASAFATDWWPVPRPTVFDDPGGWVAKLIGNLRPLGWSILSIIRSEMGVAILLSAALAGGLVLVTSRARAVRSGRPARPRDAFASHRTRVFGLVMLALCVQFSAYIVTGYFDRRYFTPILWLGALIGTGLFVRWGRSDAQRRLLGLLCFGFLAALTIAGWSVNGLLWPSDTAPGRPASWEEFDQPGIIAKLDACQAGSPADTRLLVVDAVLAARLGALAGRHAMLVPLNMARGRLDQDGVRAFLDRWQVDFVLVDASDRVEIFRTTLSDVPVPDCDLDLYRVN